MSFPGCSAPPNVRIVKSQDSAIWPASGLAHDALNDCPVPQWGEDGSLVDVRIGIGDSIGTELNGDGDPSQHRQKRVQAFDGIEMAAVGPSTEQEHAEAEPHTPSVRCLQTQPSGAPFAYMPNTTGAFNGSFARPMLQSDQLKGELRADARLARDVNLCTLSVIAAVSQPRKALPCCNWQVAEPREPEPPPPSRFPLVKIAEVLALWGVYLALQLVKSRYNRCAAPYFGIFASQVPRTGCFTEIFDSEVLSRAEVARLHQK